MDVGKNVLIILIGPINSGHIFFAKYLISKGYKLGTDYTDNKLLSEDINYEYRKEIKSSLYYSNYSHNNIKYGLSFDGVYKSDFIIRNPISLKYTLDYLKDIKRKYITIYFDIHKELRINKLISLFNLSKVKQIIKLEDEMYNNFKINPTITVKNEKFKPNILLNIINELKNK